MNVIDVSDELRMVSSEGLQSTLKISRIERSLIRLIRRSLVTTLRTLAAVSGLRAVYGRLLLESSSSSSRLCRTVLNTSKTYEVELHFHKVSTIPDFERKLDTCWRCSVTSKERS